MLEAISRCKNGETSHIGEYKGFEVLIEKNYIGLHNIVLRGQADYKAEFKEKTARLDKLNIQLGLEDGRTGNVVKGKESSMVAESGSYHKKTDMNR